MFFVCTKLPGSGADITGRVDTCASFFPRFRNTRAILAKNCAPLLPLFDILSLTLSTGLLAKEVHEVDVVEATLSECTLSTGSLVIEEQEVDTVEVMLIERTRYGTYH